jgi:hypothetical protein
VYERADLLQLVVLHFHGGCAAPRDSGGDRAPIELPTSGRHCSTAAKSAIFSSGVQALGFLLMARAPCQIRRKIVLRHEPPLGGRETKCESRDQVQKVSVARAWVAFAPKLTAAVKHLSA